MIGKSPPLNSTTRYQLPVAEVRESLVVDVVGLTSNEAGVRMAKYGYNELKVQEAGAAYAVEQQRVGSIGT